MNWIKENVLIIIKQMYDFWRDIILPVIESMLDAYANRLNGRTNDTRMD